MNRRRILSGTVGASVTTVVGCLSRDEERTKTITRDIREFLGSNSGYSEEIAVLDAVEVEESDFHPGGVSVGVRHILPFTAGDDPETIRDAVNSNSYRIAAVSLETTREIFRIEMTSYLLSTEEGTSPEVSFVHLRWDTFDEVDWATIEPADVPDVAVHYRFDETVF